MKAKDTYRVLRATLGPWLKENGFKSIHGSMPMYSKQSASRFLGVKLRCHSDGWNPYKGSKFGVWVTTDPATLLDDSSKNQLANRLTLPELEYIRARQNRILQSIPAPPPEYIQSIVAGFEKVFRNPAPYIAVFLSDWNLVKKPYTRDEHIWLRYFREDDVRSWAILIHNHLRSIHARWESEREAA